MSDRKYTILCVVPNVQQNWNFILPNGKQEDNKISNRKGGWDCCASKSRIVAADVSERVCHRDMETT